MELTWNHLSCKLAFMVLEGTTIQASKQGKQPIGLPSYVAYELQQPVCHNNNPKGAILTSMPWK